jgi:hypothetical protein
MHIHLGVRETIATFASVIIVGFFWRLVSGMNKDNSVGKAMSFIY